nr:putative reverse transcriptase domain-containing protein [Tanacetum cinerariifolium]
DSGGSVGYCSWSREVAETIGSGGFGFGGKARKVREVEDGLLKSLGYWQDIKALYACDALTKRVENLEYDKVAQALEITKLKRRVKKMEKANRVKVLKLRRLKKVGTSLRINTSDDNVMEDASNQGRMIDALDSDAGVALMDDKEEEKKAEEAKEDEPAEVQEVVDVVTTAKLITEVVTAASKSVTAASTTISAAEPQVPTAIITAVPIKEQLEEDENRAIQRINKTPAQKAAKRSKLNKEVEDLKRHLEMVPDEDDDVYTEATPLARKVHVVDYEIIHLNNKPHYKIIQADGKHQLPDGQAQVWKNQRTNHGQAKFLGHVIDSQGIHVDSAKIKAVKNWASPTTPIEPKLRQSKKKISKLRTYEEWTKHLKYILIELIVSRIEVGYHSLPLEFQVEDHVMLKVSPRKGVIQFGKRGKLNPQYIGPFKILKKVRPVAYKLELPGELRNVHNTFYVSNLKKCLSDESLVIPMKELWLDDKLNFMEELVEIMDREVKQLKLSHIPIVKVKWNSRSGPAFTWERKDQICAKYPHLFPNTTLSSN